MLFFQVAANLGTGDLEAALNRSPNNHVYALLHFILRFIISFISFNAHPTFPPTIILASFLLSRQNNAPLVPKITSPGDTSQFQEYAENEKVFQIGKTLVYGPEFDDF